MKWIEARVIFNFENKRLAMELIADVFYDHDLQGVVFEEPKIELPEDWGNDAVIPEHYSVIAYLPFDDKLKKRCKNVEANLAKLEKSIGIQSHIVYSDMDEADWAESWKAYFKPEKITDNIVVKPTWHEYSQSHDEIVLEIDPGMAFGTGIHATTGMCIGMIEKYLKKGDSFLDVGTGSGILMIAAAKLGARRVWGTDNDNVAVDVARKNLLGNGIARATYEVISGNLIEKVTEQFNLVSANLTTKTILVLLEDIKRVMVQNSIFICSGILDDDKGRVLEEIEKLDFVVIEILTRENWLSIACRPKYF